MNASWSPLLPAFAACLALMAVSEPAGAAGRRNQAHQEATLARCIRDASRGKAWLEKTLWGLRDQEAGWVGAQVANKNGSHDLGPLQVNSYWVPKLASVLGQSPTVVRSWLTYDACFNVEAGRWIFLSGLSQTGDYWKAIGIYHSPTAWRQRQYSSSVAAHLRRRFGHGIFAGTRALSGASSDVRSQ
jgi:hypothetical protein